MKINDMILKFLKFEDQRDFENAYKIVQSLVKVSDCPFLDVIYMLETERNYRNGEITIDEKFL